MTYLDTLRELAEAQVRHNPDQMMFVPGQRILQLLAVIEAAKAMRDSRRASPRTKFEIAFDAALAALEGDK